MATSKTDKPLVTANTSVGIECPSLSREAMKSCQGHYFQHLVAFWNFVSSVYFFLGVEIASDFSYRRCELISYACPWGPGRKWVHLPQIKWIIHIASGSKGDRQHKNAETAGNKIKDVPQKIKENKHWGRKANSFGFLPGAHSFEFDQFSVLLYIVLLKALDTAQKTRKSKDD